MFRKTKIKKEPLIIEETKVEIEPVKKPLPQPAGLPLAIVEALRTINVKLDQLIKKDEAVHKELEK